jgi:2C-methyl-D-erythritol 2,4-cyclodiphosphate synthase
MKYKTLLFAIPLLFLPMISMAEAEVVATTTEVVEAPKLTEQQEALKKQLADTINIYSATVNSIKRLAGRVVEREAILIEQKNLSEEAQKMLDSKLATLDKKLTNADTVIDTTLTKLADTVVNSAKPATQLRTFKKEANKVKVEIIASHKLITEIIGIVKKESFKIDSAEVEATTTEQESN